MQRQTCALWFVLGVMFLFHDATASYWKRLEFEDCGSSGAVVEVVKMHPAHPERGHTLVIHTKFKSDTNITSGSLHIKVTRKILGRPISFSGTTDICGMLKEGHKCPIQAGESVVLISERVLTIFTPYGDYEFEIKSYDQDHRMLTCIKTVLHFYPSARTMRVMT
eukprot:g8473.t1